MAQEKLKQMQVKRPTEIRILSTVYKIEWVTKGAAQGACGWYDGGNDVIGIREDMSPSAIADTFVHEIMHALWRLMSLGPEARNEGVCTVMATGLVTVWSQNPEVFAWLNNQITEVAPSEDSSEPLSNP